LFFSGQIQYLHEKFFGIIMAAIDSSMTIQELLEQHPQAIATFIKNRMQCVGCPAQAFHTVADVAQIYGSPIDTLCNAIHGTIQTE
jgi:hybrid cluster-associated redox disulfide protein